MFTQNNGKAQLMKTVITGLYHVIHCPGLLEKGERTGK
jgi:hypothetical protein